MKNFFAVFLILCTSILAKADLIGKAVLDITCTSDENPKVIKIISKAEGSSVEVNGLIVNEDEQLMGGTEGGDPYLQAVGGGYNITLVGGDFQTAFYDRTTIENGTAKAYVNAYDINESYKATCIGKYSFVEE